MTAPNLAPRPSERVRDGRGIADIANEIFRADLLTNPFRRGALLVCLLLLCVVRTYLGGPFAMKRYGPDAFILLDGGWRILNGQIPHVDFHTPIGPVIYLLVALGLKAASLGASGLNYAQAIAGAVAALWAYRLGARRLSDVASVLFCLFAVLLALAPYELGESPLLSSPSFTYNRYGYVLLVLILCETLWPPLDRSSLGREELAGGISTGIAGGLLLFLKANFFLAAGMLVVGLWISRKQQWNRWVGIGCSGLAVCVCGLLYLHGHWTAMWSDLRMAAGGKHIEADFLRHILVDNAGVMTAVLLLALFTSWVRAGINTENETRHLTYSALVICAVSYAVMLGNHQEAGMPLCTAFVIGLMSAVTDRKRTGNRAAPALLCAAVLCWGTVVVLAPIAADAAGIGYAAMQSLASRNRNIVKAEAPRLSGLLFVGPATSRDFGPSYVGCVNDGLRMLREVPASDAVVTLANTDPFSYALEKRPARDGLTWIADGNNVSERFKPAPEAVFRDAAAVIVSNYVTDGGAVRLYGAYVSRNYHLVRRSSCWDLYRR